MFNWLEFTSILIWQGVAVWVIWLFRTDLQALIGRVLSIKHGDACEDGIHYAGLA